MTKLSTPTDLDELRDAIRTYEERQAADLEVTLWDGAPTHLGELDWTDLPVFGGTHPDNTDGIWSWDDSRLLVGESAGDLEIVEREG